MVCLGNICRSPMAEGIMRLKIKKYKLAATVDSAGTSSCHQGEHPDKRSILSGAKHGVDISNLVSRPFIVNDFEQFDVIYAMDSENMNNIIQLAGNENNREKVKLILNEIYPSINKAVPDPYFGGEYDFEIVFSLLDKACEVIAKKINR